jgi:hypothetical protein
MLMEIAIAGACSKKKAPFPVISNERSEEKSPQEISPYGRYDSGDSVIAREQSDRGPAEEGIASRQSAKIA